MTPSFKTSEDLIVRIMNGRFIISNVFARTHFQVNALFLEMLAYLNTPRNAEEIATFLKDGLHSLSIIPRTAFSLHACLLDNPDNFSLSTPDDSITFADADGLTNYLKVNLLIYDDRHEYRERFGLKNSMLDRGHLGNFHQQVGFHALVQKKIRPDDWWVKQKFTDDQTRIRDTAYKHIQENFIRGYFNKERMNGIRLLDVGCGNGYYDKILAENGATVCGIDTNEKHIEFARSTNTCGHLEFKHADAGHILEGFERNSYDAILLSDVLLFYTVNPEPNQPISPLGDFLMGLHRILKQDGRLYVLEPHGVFFLQGWYGENDRPFTVISEYRHRVFRVSPTLEELARAFAGSGFAIEEILEPKIDERMKTIDPKTYAFYSEFPAWWFFNLSKKW